MICRFCNNEMFPSTDNRYNYYLCTNHGDVKFQCAFFLMKKFTNDNEIHILSIL